MAKRHLSFTAVLLALVLAVPAGALAQDNSAIDEYVEGVPGAGGDKPSGDPAGGGAGGSDGGGDAGDPAPLPAGNAQALAAQGPAGAAAADLAQATAPSGGSGAPGGNGGSRTGSAESGSGGGASASDGGGVPSVGDVVGGLSSDGGSDGLGSVLPIILIASLVAALAFVALRRRGGTGPTEA